MSTSPFHYLTLFKDNRHQAPSNTIRPNLELWHQRRMCINTVTFHPQSQNGTHYLNKFTTSTIWTISRLLWSIVKCSFFPLCFFSFFFCFAFSNFVIFLTRYCFATFLSIQLDVDVDVVTQSNFCFNVFLFMEDHIHWYLFIMKIIWFTTGTIVFLQESDCQFSSCQIHKSLSFFFFWKAKTDIYQCN